MQPKDWRPPAEYLPEPYDYYCLADLDHPLGRGGQGLVYLAESDRHAVYLGAADPMVSKGLAIKFFIGDRWSGSAGLLTAFMQEALVGQTLRSHNLGHTLEVLDLRPHADWPPVALAAAAVDLCGWPG